MADKTGYIGRNPGDSSVTIARQTFTPTSDTTEFSFTSGYTVGLCDVYLNGVKLVDARDYDANTGSTVGLTSAAVSGDIVEIIAYKAFNLGQVSSSSGNFTVGSNLSVGSTATLSGVTTCEGDLYVGGDLYGDGSNLTGIAATDYVVANTLKVLGISTFSGEVTVAGGVDVTGGVKSAGIVTFTNTTASTSTSTGALVVSGGVGIAGSLHVGENVSVGGTLTYEDVTNIDSVGFITARTGIKVLAGGVDITAGGLKVAGISTFGGGDIQIDGSAAGVSSVTWDASANSLIWKDNSKAVFGDGSDLTLYHTGSESHIQEQGTGGLILNSSVTTIKNGSDTETIARFTENGGVDLNFDNSTKFATTNTGAVVTGIATASDFVIGAGGTSVHTALGTKASTGKAIAMAMVFG